MDCGESESVGGKTFLVVVPDQTTETVVCIIKEWYYYSKQLLGCLQHTSKMKGTLTWQSTIQQHSQHYLSHKYCTVSKQFEDMSWPHLICTTENRLHTATYQMSRINERQRTIHFSSSWTHTRRTSELQNQKTFENDNPNPKALLMSVYEQMKTLYYCYFARSPDSTITTVSRLYVGRSRIWFLTDKRVFSSP